MSEHIIDRHEAIDLLRRAVKKRGRRFRYPKPDEWNPFLKSAKYEYAHHFKTATCYYVLDRSKVTKKTAERFQAETDLFPGCIVGLALSLLGGTVLDGWDDITLPIISQVPQSKYGLDADGNQVRLDEEAINLIQLAQDLQDEGMEWGMAMKRVENYYEELNGRPRSD